MKQVSFIRILFILCVSFVLLNFSGCIENNDEESETTDVDLGLVKLQIDELVESEFEKLPNPNEHVTDPYVVSEGKLFAGLKVKEKIELNFVKSPDFVIQQSAELYSTEKAEEFVEHLKETDSFPGTLNDWNFTTVPIKLIGTNSVLKQNVSMLEGEETTITMLVFRVDHIVSIVVGSVPKEDIITYGNIIEGKINEQLV